MFKFSKGMAGVTPMKVLLRHLKNKKNDSDSDENKIERDY
jgi:hypothetical protein